MIETKDFLKRKFKTDVIENKAKQREWLTWYQNNNHWRNYQITLANERRTKKSRIRYTLNSCKRVCEDWANLLLNEKTDIVISGKNGDEQNQSKNTYNEQLHEILDRNDFWVLGNKGVEKTWSIGAGAFIVGKDADDKVTIEFVDGTRCYILKCNADDVIDCAFENSMTIKGEKYTIVNVHIKNEKDDGYTIYNYLFNEDGGEVSPEMMKQLINVEPESTSKVKTFTFLTPQNLSATNWDTPFADSVFAKGIDANKMIDLAFDSYCNEFILGKKRIFVATELMTYAQEKKNGEKTTTVRVPVFDENEVVFDLLPEQSNGESLIKEIDMKLRTNEHQSAIQDALNFFASLCGLGEKYYKYENGNVSTATQIVSENSELFRNIQKQEIQIERCLKELVRAIFGLMDVDVETIGEITIQFDDSIIEDKDTERKRDLVDVDKGIMSKAEYRAKWYGETTEQAQKIIDEIESKEVEQNADGEKFLV